LPLLVFYPFRFYVVVLGVLLVFLGFIFPSWTFIYAYFSVVSPRGRFCWSLCDLGGAPFLVLSSPRHFVVMLAYFTTYFRT
jgi:hypothetical protein